MTTVAHSTLTGADLHDAKGVSTATIGQVYVATGAGSGTWQLLGTASMGSTANPFGSGLLQVQEQQTTGTNSATVAVSSGWTPRILNTTVVNQISGASLASNQVTLPAGTYMVSAYVPAIGCGRSQSRIQDMTHSTTLVIGVSSFTNPAANYGVSDSSVTGRFTLSGSTVIELDHWEQATGSSTYGNAANTGLTEVYAQLLIWKVA